MLSNTQEKPYISGFAKVSSSEITASGIVISKYKHEKFGTEHIHISSENLENAFLVALKTPPTDSSGVFHVIEHLITCGSNKFPINNLFFKMRQRSVSSFMNAFTSSDWTAFPFSSSNEQDFTNLLHVYLDAVFFSKLDPLDFAQEGCRLEFTEPDNLDSPLFFNGVVLNEMKGAMSDPAEVVWDKLVSHLYQGSCYQFNHGGEPQQLTQLTYENLVETYHRHYHPGNAVFITCGEIPAEKHQQIFESQVLSRFSVKNNETDNYFPFGFSAPRFIEDVYAAPMIHQENYAHYSISWLIGDGANFMDVLEAELLSGALLTNGDSPILNELLTRELIDGPSEFTGVDFERRAISFTCGFEQVKPENIKEIESIVFNTLQQVAAEGIPHAVLENVLNDLAIEKMSVNSDFMPNNIKLLFDVLPAALYGTDPLQSLDIRNVINQLKEKIKEPEFVKRLVRKHLIDNTNRLSLTLKPSPELTAVQEQKEQQQLLDLSHELSAEEKLAIVEQNKALVTRQTKPSNDDVLPKIELNDLKLHCDECNFPKKQVIGPVNVFSLPANGITYQDVYVDVSTLSFEMQKQLKLFSQLITYLDRAQDCEALSFHLKNNRSSFVKAGYLADQSNTTKVLFGLSIKSLSESFEPANELLRKTLLKSRFDNVEQLKQLLPQIQINLEQNLLHGGHMLVMSAACAGFSHAEALSHQWHGLEGIRSIRQLNAVIFKKERYAENLCNELSELHQTLIKSPYQLQVTGDSSILDNLEDIIQTNWLLSPIYPQQNNIKALEAKVVRQLWTTHTHLNFCAMAFPTVKHGHADEAALVVLGYFLHNGYLNLTLREQGGAYGVGANQESSVGAFRFFTSYDPQIKNTIEHFYQSVKWMIDGCHEQAQLESAIIRAIAELDKNVSLVENVKKSFIDEMFGIGAQHKQNLREALLSVSLDDLRRVASEYLTVDKANIVILTDHANKSLASQLGLQHIAIEDCEI